jgi:hypothetical protein
MRLPRHIITLLTVTIFLSTCVGRQDFPLYKDVTLGSLDLLTDGKTADGNAGLDTPDINIGDLKGGDSALDSQPDETTETDVCTPDCEGRACGDDGCGGTCWTGGGTECDDGEWCNGEESCDEDGLCQQGTAPELADDFACTVDECDEDTDQPTHTNDDGLCNDNNPCTADACLPDNESANDDGCVHTALDDGDNIACDDGNPCTADQCLTGECSNVLLPIEQLTVDECICTLKEDCTDLEDGAVCNGTLDCLPDPDNEEVSVCQVAAESIAGCDDDNPCTDDACEPEAEGADSDGCTFAAVEDETVPLGEDDENLCTDDDACTINHRCFEGECADDPYNCSDDNVCTDDTCLDQDGESKCFYANNDDGCDDAWPCTDNDTCANAVCAGSPNNDNCDDGNPCTIDACDPEAEGLDEYGCTHLPVVDGPEPLCADNDPCTIDHRCEAGVCALSPYDCEDGNACTDNECTNDNDQPKCIFSFNVAQCDDLIDCTENDTCTNGDCAGTPNDTLCLDETVCDGTESCLAGQGCIEGDPLDCDDLLDCTLDSCDPVDGCQHQAQDVECDDASLCTIEICVVDVGCQYTDVVCADQEPCTVDTCDADAGCLYTPDDDSCDDQQPCTIDACSADTGCSSTPDNTFCDDANECTADHCSANLGCQYETAGLDSIACSDGDPCTEGDVCQGGTCIPGQELALICSDFDHDGLGGVDDLCPYAFDPDNLDLNSDQQADACVPVAAVADYLYSRDLTLSQDGAASTWRRTHEPVEIPLANGILDDSVVGYWRLSGGQGTDFSGSSYHGVPDKVTAVAGVFGKPDGAAQFNGTDSRVLLPVFKDVDGTSHLSFSAWVKPASYDTQESSNASAILNRLHVDGLKGHSNFALSEGKFFMHLEFENDFVQIQSDMIPLNVWSHLAAVYDGSYVYLFVNGVLTSTKSITYDGAILNGQKLLTNDYPFAIGCTYSVGGGDYPCSSNNAFDGSIQEVLLVNRIFSPEEIEAYYRSAAPYGTAFVPGAQRDFDDVKVTETTGDGDGDVNGDDDGSETLKRSRIVGVREHSDTPCPMVEDDGSWADREDLCGVAAYWRLDGDAVDVLEVSDGVNNGAVPARGRFGESGGAMAFTQRQKRLEVSGVEAGALNPETGPLTVEAWLRFPSQSGSVYHPVHKKGTMDTTGYQISYTVSSGIVTCEFFGTFQNIIKSAATDPINDRGWHHVACVMTGGTNQELKVYIDGLERESQKVSGPNIGTLSNAAPFKIGWANGDGEIGQYVDEVLVHFVAKSADYIYHRARPGVPKVRFLANTVVENQGSDQAPAYPLRGYKMYWGDDDATAAMPFVSSLPEAPEVVPEKCYGLLNGCHGYAGWWRLNEGRGDVAVDSSGWKWLATTNDLSFRDGIAGTAGDFNGDSTYLKLVQDFIPESQFTVEAVTSFDSMAKGEWDQVVRWGKNGQNDGFSLYKSEEDADYESDGESLLFLSYHNSINNHIGTSPAVIGEWQHIAGKLDAGEAEFFAHHQSIGKQQWDYNHPQEGVFRIGGRHDAVPDLAQLAEAVDGAIDEVRISNRALEPDEFLHFPLVEWVWGEMID